MRMKTVPVLIAAVWLAAAAGFVPGAASVCAAERTPHGIPGMTDAAPAGTAEQPASGRSTPITVAHRGASARAPENTMAAFRIAHAMGADYIELDVRATRDGRLVVLHDATVDRTTDGKGAVGELTYRQLRSLDAGGWFDPGYAGERVPSLDEVLDRLAGKIGLIIELKQPERYPGIERLLARELIMRRLDLPSEQGVIIQSFDTDALRTVRTLLPHVPIAVLIDKPKHVTTADLLDYWQFADALHVLHTGLHEPLVSRIRSYGMAVIAWNVRSSYDIHAMERAGVDGITADDPALVALYARSRP